MEAAQPKVKRCRTKRCRGRAWKHHHSPYCSRCRNRHWREKNPLRYSFKNLRNRAKHRGHAFALTFEQYRKFAHDTGYAELKGKTKTSLSIHRRCNHLGYSADNITAVTLSLNSRLQWANIPESLKQEMIEAEQASYARN